MAMMATPHDDILRQAWNQSFTTTFSARSSPFHVISSSMDLGYYQLCYLPEERKKHLIFYRCDTILLLQATQELTTRKKDKEKDTFLRKKKPDVEEGEEEGGDCVIESVAFVNCHFGRELDDIKLLLTMWMSTTSLQALSFSRCVLPPMNIDKDPFFKSGMFAKLKRLEVETTCRDVSLTKLFGICKSLVAVSQRHICDCNNALHQNGGKGPHLYSGNMLPFLQDQGKFLEEVEFDMNPLSKEELALCFDALGQSQRLSTISLNLKNVNGPAMDLHSILFKAVKRLRAVEIKGGGYFPTFDPKLNAKKPINVLEMLLPHRRYLQHIRITDVVSTYTKQKICLSQSLDEFESLESIHISNCNIFDIFESLEGFLSTHHQDIVKLKYKPKKFKAAELPHLLGFELRGANDLEWRFLRELVYHMPLLVKLDISGLNKRQLPDEDDLTLNTGYHPVITVFQKLGRLRELVMDDLEIGDDTLFRGVGKKEKLDVQSKKKLAVVMGGGGATEFGPCLASLQELKILSIQSTDVTDMTVRCVGLYMPNLTQLNVSFTQVTEAVIEEARTRNPMLEVISTGCRISPLVQSKFRNPEWSRFIRNEEEVAAAAAAATTSNEDIEVITLD